MLTRFFKPLKTCNRLKTDLERYRHLSIFKMGDISSDTKSEYFTILQSSSKPPINKLSKKQMKKLAKGKKIKKEKPKWNLDGKKKKEKTMNLNENEIFVNKTPPGEKKDLSGEIAEKYNPIAVESSWDLWWEKQGFYHCSIKEVQGLPQDKKFIMMLPPPNVTGTLHIGHALMVTIQDTLARYNRMIGKKVLWLPGTDHAGIGTQAVVEKNILKTEGKTRFDFKREEFVQKCWDWTNEKGGSIMTQIKKLGASLDHERNVFTLDDIRTKAVIQAFNKLYEKKLIYRKKRLVNWSCPLSTAISNIEVDLKEIDKKIKINIKSHNNKKYEFGVLTEFKYKVCNSEEKIIVATTRLETMLGDVAVCVHPEDKRYLHLHGKYVEHPFFKRKLPIICDAELVDMNFGTGCVKITPAHDENDFNCGERHKLPMLNMLSDDGKIDVTECRGEEKTSLGDKFHGMLRYDARKEIEAELEKLGLLGEKKDNKMILPICSKSGDIVEPRLKEQWWLDTDEMAKRSIEVVEKGDLKLIPSYHVATWNRFLTDPHQWCISRQLWWGHRIPAFKIVSKDESDESSKQAVVKQNEGNEWIIAEDMDHALKKLEVLKQTANISNDSSLILEQDADVLDTWFSSGLFPFSTLGWPEETDDLKNFFPGTLLETGHDILFFWVARMVMMSLTLHDKLPFNTVYLHAMVRDRFGRKMSKSLGNIIDPLAVINGSTLEELHATLLKSNLPEKEIKKAIKGQKQDYPEGIPQCGADALRAGLLANITQGRDVNLDVNNVFSLRKFCNKIWQVTRFSIIICGKDFQPKPNFLENLKNEKLSIRDKWILNQLRIFVENSNENLEKYFFGEYVSNISHFWLTKLCDVYVESIKPLMRDDKSRQDEAEISRNVLFLCLDFGLKLMHPVMPFVTEELWNHLPGNSKLISTGKIEKSLMTSKFPQKIDFDQNCPDLSKEVEIFETADKVSHAMRSLKSDYNITRKDVKFLLFVDIGRFSDLEQVSEDMNNLGSGLVDLKKETEIKQFSTGYLSVVIDGHLQLMMEIKGNVDIEARIKKLTKEKTASERSKESLEKKLINEKFLANAPKEVLEESKTKLEDLKGVIEKLETQIKSLSLL